MGMSEWRPRRPGSYAQHRKPKKILPRIIATAALIAGLGSGIGGGLATASAAPQNPAAVAQVAGVLAHQVPSMAQPELATYRIEALPTDPALAKPGAFRELKHPRYNLVRRIRVEARLAEQASDQSASSPQTSATVTATGFGVWDCIVQYEASPPGNWATDTGNGYYGGLQFTEQTWLGYGGSAYAQYADDATAGQQVAVANKVLAAQGWGAWPVSSQKCGVGTQSESAVLMTLHRRHRDRDEPLRLRAWHWALKQRGCPYSYGAVGPCSSGFDCSGLIMEAYDHAGVHLPRTTEEMQNSNMLVRVSHPKRGDIILFGWPAYHAAMYTRHWTMFAASDYGIPIGWSHIWQSAQPQFYRVVR